MAVALKRALLGLSHITGLDAKRIRVPLSNEFHVREFLTKWSILLGCTRSDEKARRFSRDGLSIDTLARPAKRAQWASSLVLVLEDEELIRRDLDVSLAEDG
ncbi:hypothetical protein CK228_25310 [Mesorhizobium sp. WSM4312]|nr:hypothetical protein CK228_25310 [Mesorhizobium sp. WSM4312]